MTNRYLFFPNWELKCKCGKCAYNQNDMNAIFMSKLVSMRMAADFPFYLTRAISCLEWDKLKGGVGIHPGGHCVDISPRTQEQVVWIYQNCEDFGVAGLGIKMHGPWGHRLIHLDDLIWTKEHHRPAIWTYT